MEKKQLMDSTTDSFTQINACAGTDIATAPGSWGKVTGNTTTVIGTSGPAAGPSTPPNRTSTVGNFQATSPFPDAPSPTPSSPESPARRRLRRAAFEQISFLPGSKPNF